MTLPKFLAPPAEVSRFETGLTFTDILFGFVISQIFTRLEKWSQLPWLARWELITATALVLGSWIGFRRSRNRSRYELKFFNLPLVRFLLDQTMVILYFRIATLVPDQPHPVINPHDLVHKATLTLLIVFCLYTVWDVAGLLMAYVGRSATPKYKYPKINEDTNEMSEGVQSSPDFRGTTISLVGAVMFLLLFLVFYHGISVSSINVHGVTVHTRQAEIAFIVAISLLLGYRWAKEVRTSYR